MLSTLFSVIFLHRCAVVALLCVSTISLRISAEPLAAGCTGNSPDEELILQEAECMSDDELQTFRGGFVRDNQIVIGFGFERIVRVDGEVQEHLIAGLPSLNLASNIQLVPVSRSLDAGNDRYLLDLDSNDAASQDRFVNGNSISPQMQLVPSSTALQEMMSNVIQNNLDGKVIDQVRVVNIDLMGLGGGVRVDPHNDLHQAIFESLGR